MNDIAHYNANALTSRSPYRDAVASVALKTLIAQLGEEEGQRKAVQMTLAFQAAAQANPALFNLPADSVGRALAVCLLADLMPGGMHPQVWLLPKGNALQTWIAPHGYRELARRAGAFLQEIPVWRGEESDAEAGAERVAEGRVYVPKPTTAARGMDDLIGFYIVVRDQIGARVEWLSVDEIMQRRSVATTKNVWDKWPMEMARKTALKWAFNRGLVSTERAAAAALSMETEQEIVPRLPAPTTSERAARMGLPAVVDAEMDGDDDHTPAAHAQGEGL